MKNKLAAFLIFCLTASVFGSCASDPEEYSTSHDAKYEITYLLTDFENIGNRNAESIWRALINGDDPHMGYAYMFDDNKTDDDWVVPHAGSSNMCVDDEGNNLNPYPAACEVYTGYIPNAQNPVPLPFFQSQKSFHWSGTAVMSGVGFGIYFADYVFAQPFMPGNTSRLQISPQYKIAASFSNGRKDTAGISLCSDDASFDGTVDPAFRNPATRVPYLDRDKWDSEGLYRVEGPVWTAGVVYVDTDDVEHYELDYNRRVTSSDKEKIKEPRCLVDMGQKGFVMWARGNADIEVALIMPQTAPNFDGGTCDLDGGEKCYDHLRVIFPLDDQWREYHASWDDFSQEGWGPAVALDPNRIINVQIKVSGYKQYDRGKDFDIWMDQIGFYGGKPWPFMPQQ